MMGGGCLDSAFAHLGQFDSRPSIIHRHGARHMDSAMGTWSFAYDTLNLAGSIKGDVKKKHFS
jgi:hypothetical protein